MWVDFASTSIWGHFSNHSEIFFSFSTFFLYFDGFGFFFHFDGLGFILFRWIWFFFVGSISIKLRSVKPAFCLIIEFTYFVLFTCFSNQKLAKMNTIKVPTNGLNNLHLDNGSTSNGSTSNGNNHKLSASPISGSPFRSRSFSQSSATQGDEL